MSDCPRMTRWLFWLVGASTALGVVGVLGLVFWPRPRPAPEAEPPLQEFPLPPYSDSPYLNTGPDAHYIGTSACAECHSAKLHSYRLTAHSQALSDVDPKAEPPDGAFDHAPSQRSYRVYRQDGQLRHQELLRTEEGKVIARVDLPVRYLIGSGHYARTYLVEVDGFLHESPITWYASKQQWGMSPGYDTAHHGGFERPVRVDCLVCHAGQVAATGGSVHRLSFREKAIGCENCHGPGSLHRDRQRAHRIDPGEADLTIVNPSKLSRSLQEAICASCHLSGSATILLRGRQVTDFRPGKPLSDYRTDYRFDVGSDSMTVVGHVEQMRQSVCYQKAKDLTCVTCHDPHQREVPQDTVAFYRQKCLNCHTSQACRLEEAQRRRQDAADNCAACHMPRGDTEIPHLVFTHHRIGRHTATPPAESGRLPNLVPINDISRLTPLDQERNLGLAYAEVARDPLHARYAEAFRDRAIQHLEAVSAKELREGEISALFGFVYLSKDPARAMTYARQALAAADTPPRERAMVLLYLAKLERQERDLPSAIGHLEEAVTLRRTWEDWHLLGVNYLEQKQPDKALTALQQALAISPYRQKIHLGLAAVYRQQGDLKRAQEHVETAKWLFDHHQE